MESALVHYRLFVDGAVILASFRDMKWREFARVDFLPFAIHTFHLDGRFFGDPVFISFALVEGRGHRNLKWASATDNGFMGVRRAEISGTAGVLTGNFVLIESVCVVGC